VKLPADGPGGDIVTDPKDLDKEGHFEEDEDHHLHGNNLQFRDCPERRSEEVSQPAGAAGRTSFRKAGDR
jgi:hypothetical protein